MIRRCTFVVASLVKANAYDRKLACHITTNSAKVRKKNHTLKQGSESGSISRENVQVTKVCHGGSDIFLRLLDITHVRCGQNRALRALFLNGIVSALVRPESRVRCWLICSRLSCLGPRLSDSRGRTSPQRNRTHPKAMESHLHLPSEIPFSIQSDSVSTSSKILR